MGTSVGKATLTEWGMMVPAIESAGENDLVIVAKSDDEKAFEKAILEIEQALENRDLDKSQKRSYLSIDRAVEDNPNANICLISISGNYVRAEAERALNSGLHVLIFSNQVPLKDELAIKELAREKGLLCMGPDCGVVNLNEISFVLGSITRKGPFGICGASGIGLQQIGALIHSAGSGVSQIIGTGGNDLKHPIGGITIMMGIDALENDPDTEYIVLVSRKPDDKILQTVLERIAKCKKPVVMYCMGCDKERIEASGAIWASSLDDATQKALAFVSKQIYLESDEQIKEMAEEAVQGMNAQQKYLRGIYGGGTYCDEAMHVLEGMIGGVYSNVPFSDELRLEDSHRSVKNTIVDYGEEEFTLGRPHPVIDPSVRQPAIMREANDPEVAVLLFDFVLSPAGYIDPVGALLDEIKAAMEAAEKRGGKLAVIASICGTDADPQNLILQKEKLIRAGVWVCQTNYRAAMLAGEIIRRREGGSHNG
jgi:succinyl-CoA synthetase alpha subunit